MPVRNEARFIRRSLGGVLAQDYPPECVEVLVVDGMSDDETRGIILAMTGETRDGVPVGQSEQSVSGKPSPSLHISPFDIRILDNPSRIVPTALNIGLRKARGEIIFRLDGHSEMAPSYLRRCVARLQERPDVACVAGPSVAVGSGWIGGAYALALQSPFGVGGRTFRTLRTESYVDTLAFGGYRREVFDKMGEFDTSLERNQDIEFSSRLRKAGYCLLLIPDTETYYHAPEELGAILRQNYNNGYWNAKVFDRMLHILSWRHFVPGIFVIFLLVSILAAITLPGGLYLLLLIAGSYTLVALLATASIAIHHRRRAVLILPFVFVLMHVGYGLGTLAGFFRYLSNAGLRLIQRVVA